MKTAAAPPSREFRGGFGHRVNDMQGPAQLLRLLALPGILRSRFQTSFVNLASRFSPGWTMKAEFDCYGYGGDGPAGPAAPRNFHCNIHTLGTHDQF